MGLERICSRKNDLFSICFKGKPMQNLNEYIYMNITSNKFNNDDFIFTPVLYKSNINFKANNEGSHLKNTDTRTSHSIQFLKIKQYLNQKIN